METDIFVHMIAECLRKYDILIQENFSEAKNNLENCTGCQEMFLVTRFHVPPTFYTKLWSILAR
jgi:hypothetical protein